MKFDFSLQNIVSNSRDFLSDNPSISSNEYLGEPPGKEHYFLFASLGIQLQNKKIIEFGTYRGLSCIALDYGNKKCNHNNTIFTYDICDCLIPNIFDNTNIQYRLENLFDPILREQQRDHILSSDVIFIDIDPHEGVLEWEMYQWLKDNDYKGIIIYDDILLPAGHMEVNTGNSMQQFWSKVDDQYKMDLTNVGHWSGTGLICFHLDDHEIVT